MNIFYEKFAMKTSPDNTINRILALEAQGKEFGQKINQWDLKELFERMQ